MKKLTIKELKRLIKELPDDMPIVVDGYERGLQEPETIEVCNIYTYPDNSGVYGEYINKNDQFFKLEKENNTLKLIGKAFYISRFFKEEWER